MSNNNNRIIASLCYFSIFFAGFILPLIVFLAVPEQSVKKHAKAALISHLFLVIPSILVFIGIIFFGTLSDSPPSGDAAVVITIVLFIVLALFSLAIMIWNIYRGIKVLNTEEKEAV